MFVFLWKIFKIDNNMKVLHSSLFRALCAVVVGALLIIYREQTVTWITIAIGVLFFLSGVISIATYFSARRRSADAPLVYDADGRQLTGLRPHFPIVGLGSLILGLILALMPNTFVASLMFILSAILIMGALTQFVNLASAAKMGRVGLVFWIFPSVILLVGILCVVKPSAIASAPLFVIGWAMVVYGVVECVNALKVANNRRRWQKAEEVSSVQHAADAGEAPEITVQ